MFRHRLKSLGAKLALTSLLVLNLHVLAHVFGHDDDGDHDGKAAPCALCQTVLSQTSLQAVACVQAPSGPGTPVCFVPARALAREKVFSVSVSTRGPPVAA